MSMKSDEILDHVSNAIHSRTKEYLAELNISTIESNTPLASQRVFKKTKLNTNSVIINLIGDIDIVSVISYDDILFKIADEFLEDEIFDDDEKDEIYESIAMEFANIVVGNALSNLDKNRSFIFKAPLYVKQAEYLSASKDSVIFASKIKTKYGTLLLQCIHITKNKE